MSGPVWGGNRLRQVSHSKEKCQSQNINAGQSHSRGSTFRLSYKQIYYGKGRCLKIIIIIIIIKSGSSSRISHRIKKIGLYLSSRMLIILIASFYWVPGLYKALLKIHTKQLFYRFKKKKRMWPLVTYRIEWKVRPRCRKEREKTKQGENSRWEDYWTDKKVIWKMNNEYIHFPQDLEYIPGWQK